MIIDELISLLGFDIAPGSEATADKYKQTVANVGLAVAGVVATLGAAVTGMAAFATSQAQGIVETGKFADRLQITYGRLQELDYVAGQLNESSADLRADLKNLNDTMSSNIPGEYNKGLYMLGVSARDASGKVKKVDEVLLDIADRMQGMDARKQEQFAKQLGLSGASLALIQKGREGVAQLAQEARDLNIILDESARVQAEKFSASFNKAKAVAQGFAKALAVGLLPLLTEGVEIITDWVVANGAWVRMGIEQVVTGAAEGFALFTDTAGKAFTWVKELTAGFLKLNGPLDATGAIAIAVALGITAAAAALILANLPLIIMIAGITAVVLVLEDLYNALTGQPSLIGEWAASFTQAYPEIASALGKLWGILKGIAEFFAGAFLEHFKRTVELVKGLFTLIVGAAGDLLTAINDILAGKNPFDVLLEFGTKVMDRLKAFFSEAWANMAKPWPEAVTKGLDAVLSVFSTFIGSVKTLFSDLFGGIPAMLGTALAGLGGLLSGTVDGMTGLMGGTASNLGGLADLLAGSPAGNPALVSPGAGGAAVPAGMVGGGGGGATNNNTFNINGAGNPNAVADAVLDRGGMGSAVQTQTPGSRGPVMR